MHKEGGLNFVFLGQCMDSENGKSCNQRLLWVAGSEVSKLSALTEGRFRTDINACKIKKKSP